MKERVGDRLTEEQIAQCRELGILADTGDPRMQSANGLILQIFTTAIAGAHLARRPCVWPALAPLRALWYDSV